MQPIRPIEDILEYNGIKCIVYGGAGVGKTRLTLTCPRPLYISAEQGGLSLRGSNVPSVAITTLAQLIEIRDWAMNSKESGNYDTLVLDSVSEIAENVLRVAKSNTKDGRKAHNETFEAVVANVFNSFRDLPRKHVYGICKERFDEDSISKVKQYKPSMPNGNLIREAPYKFDYVFRYVLMHDPMTQQTWQGLQCNASADAVAKDRSGQLNKWEPPELGMLFAKAMRQ